jgi:DNA-binding winged helix-turn-helix (wHTH) protein/Flp pilus assembly protein TadD
VERGHSEIFLIFGFQQPLREEFWYVLPRLAAPGIAQGMVLRFAGFELDQQRAELRGPDGGPIRLRPKTFEMLRLFAANAGRVLSKQELMEAVWPNVHVGEDSLFQCIREIRSALRDDQRQMIKLVSGRGYLFDAPVSIAPDDLPAPTEAALPAEAERIEEANAEVVPAFATSRQLPFGLRGRAAVAAVAGLCAIIGLAVAAPVFRPDLIFKRTPPTIAVMPIVNAGNDPKDAAKDAAMARGVIDRLTDGLAKIDNIRVVAPQSGAAAARPEHASAPSAQPDFGVQGELQRGAQSWTLQARMIKAATGEVQSVATVSVPIDEPDAQLQQSRLAAGVGHPLARRLNELLEASEPAAASSAKVAIEQATASINQTTRERFGMAETMLQKALAGEPDNVDLAVALAALQMRGIQMVWYSKDDAIAAEAQAGAALERALRVKPNSIPVLETYCRFLSATNRFVDSLVTCARALSFDPWNGLALYLVGLGQVHLGRFEDALATFRQADSFDTPQVSRWTWLLGAGWANMLMGHGEDALPWLQRSIAITPASGRSHMLIAAAYQQLGRIDEAKAAMKEGLKLRPGTTALNVAPPTKNASPVFVEASERIIKLMIAAGLPEG